MNINVLSKYIILFLFAILVVLSGLLIAYSAENKALQKANAFLKEQVVLRDAAINEIDKNIASLQEQVKETEQICNERIQARKDVVDFLHINPPNFAQSSKGVSTPPALNNWAGNSEAVPRPNHPLLLGNENPAHVGYFRNKEIITDEKSNIAINHINNYWGMFTTLASDSKK